MSRHHISIIVLALAMTLAWVQPSLAKSRSKTAAPPSGDAALDQMIRTDDAAAPYVPVSGVISSVDGQVVSLDVTTTSGARITLKLTVDKGTSLTLDGAATRITRLRAGLRAKAVGISTKVPTTSIDAVSK